MVARGGRELDGLGSVNGIRIQLNCECREAQSGSQTVGAKLHCREGNSPDRQLRSQSGGLVGKEVELLRQPGGWLRSSHPLKKA